MGSKETKKTIKSSFGIIPQVDILLFLAICITTIVTYYSQYHISETDRRKSIETYVDEIAGETGDCVKDSPAYSWLLKYWYENADTMDLNYEEGFGPGTATEEKCRILQKRYPDLQVLYADEEDVSQMMPEDQKLFAEIMYSWLIVRIDQIKQNYHVDYLYCVVVDDEGSEHPFEEQFYLFSGADAGSTRGTGYKDIYPLGMIVSTKGNESLQMAMKEAVDSAREGEDSVRDNPNLDETGLFIDEYTLLDWIGDHPVLIGVSFNMQQIKDQIHTVTWRGTKISMIYEFLIVQIIMVYLLLFVIRPIQRLQRNMNVYSETKKSDVVRKDLRKMLTEPVAVSIKKNEIGMLANDFINLTEEMDEHVKRIEKITADQERIAAELKVASGIQAQMVPSGYPAFPGRKDFDLYAMMDPAKEVGGDFYDYFLIDEDHLALVIADVSNKGIPAALFMVIAKTLIKNRAQMGESPGEILFHVNNQLCDGNEMSYFVTVWLAVIDLASGKGLAANAGHEHPVLCRAGGEFELVKYRHSPIIGMFQNISFKEHEFQLFPGDRVFVYTDGVPEAANTEKAMFGTDRMLSVLNQNRDLSLAELLHNMRHEIDDFCAGADQFDDITMMCLWYKGTSSV